MADTRPTKVTFVHAVYLCLLGIFQPAKLVEEETSDKRARNNFSAPIEPEQNAFIIRRAFWTALLLVIGSGILGYFVGLLFGISFGCSTPKPIAALQIVGASMLLWGTVFVRGWQIQTLCGVTFCERVNQWIYRALYFVGTAVVVSSLSWSPCVG